MSPADDCLEAVYEVTLTANGYGSYDSWKLRSDLDELQPEDESPADCDTCGAPEGHVRGCPDGDAEGRWVDAEIDRVKEEP